MKEFFYGVIKTDLIHPLGLKVKERKERAERRSRSIEEGWDVGGPRWRIGWGGLNELKRRDDTEHRR